MKRIHVSVCSLLCMLFLFSLTTCKKENNEPEHTDSTAKNVVLKVLPTVNGEEVALGTDYTINGQTVNFDFFKVYLSGIEMLNDAQTVLADNGGNAVLGGVGVDGTVIGTTTEEHFHALLFNVGIDSTTNAQDPVTAAAPLNDVEMVWGWNPGAGYKFLRMEGMVDGQAFASHAATDALFQEGVAVDLHDISAAGDTIQITLHLELNNMLEGMTITSGGNHGPTQFNTQYMNKLGTGTPFHAE